MDEPIASPLDGDAPTPFGDDVEEPLAGATNEANSSQQPQGPNKVH